MKLKIPKLIWLDLEMTGLSVENDHIIEIGTVITDWNLKPLAEGPSLAINCPAHSLETMDEWCTTHHNDSGLIQRIRSEGVDLRRAEAETLRFLSKHLEPGVSPMCGNSIHTDRLFLRHHMPSLEAFFHYRNLDVTVLKILADHWKPEMLGMPNSKRSHRAMDDVYSSINELKHYRDNLLKIKLDRLEF